MELVDYGRQHRATLRYHVTGRVPGSAEPRDVVVYGKLTGDGSGVLAGPNQRDVARSRAAPACRGAIQRAAGAGLAA